MMPASAPSVSKNSFTCCADKKENVVSGQSSKGGVDRSFPDLMSQTDLHGIIKVFVNIHAM